MAMRGEKLGGDPWIAQPTSWGYGRESLFLGSSGIHPILLSQHERLIRMGTARRKCTSGARGLVWKVYVLCVSGFP
jgi:hypothetical protein